ncbi:MAG TPA: DUF1385 domain-containing protein [Armatimonadetes bacterium]|nr:DUF1385 domain-containing protein [Armatimonadota bacterium]
MWRKAKQLTAPFTLAQVMRPLPTLTVEDAPTTAAAILRQQGCPALPVVSNGRLIGVVREQEIMGLLSQALGEGMGWEENHRVGELVQPTVVVEENLPLEEAVRLFANPSLEILPVVNQKGLYRGAITRADVIAGLYRRIRPVMVGGMATPLGVHLTTGSLRAGPGDWALVLTGLAMAGIGLLAYFIAVLVVWSVDFFQGTSYVLALLSPTIATLREPTSWVEYAQLAQPLLFLLLLRASRLAGFHAAEHQVVHALERGVPLIPEAVRRMPRPHPRCGTNLVVVATIVTVAFTLTAAGQEWGMMLLLLLVAWRPLGMWLQQVFTTRPATEGELRSGIEAAEKLITKYRTNPFYRPHLIVRIWNRGFIQVLFGLGLAYLLLVGAERMLLALAVGL